MVRSTYIAALLELYLDAPDTPARASRSDRDIAGELHREAVPLDRLAHAIRLATLRRHEGSHPPVRSLGYYRTVLERLDDNEIKPDYVDYVRDAYQRLRLNSEPRLHSQKPALSRRR